MLSQSSTKELVSAVSRIEMRIRKNLDDISNYRDIIAKLEAENLALVGKQDEIIDDMSKQKEPVEPVEDIKE